MYYDEMSKYMININIIINMFFLGFRISTQNLESVDKTFCLFFNPNSMPETQLCYSNVVHWHPVHWLISIRTIETNRLSLEWKTWSDDARS